MIKQANEKRVLVPTEKAPPPVEMPAVSRELERMEKAIGQLHNTVDALVARLEPVMSQPLGAGYAACGEGDAHKATCLVADRIERFVAGIWTVEERLRAATDGLQV